LLKQIVHEPCTVKATHIPNRVEFEAWTNFADVRRPERFFGWRKVARAFPACAVEHASCVAQDLSAALSNSDARQFSRFDAQDAATPGLVASAVF
jgi:hypothetical protein